VKGRTIADYADLAISEALHVFSGPVRRTRLRHRACAPARTGWVLHIGGRWTQKSTLTGDGAVTFAADLPGDFMSRGTCCHTHRSTMPVRCG
jgi:hypothetical protein